MDYKTILQKIQNDPYFIEFIHDRCMNTAGEKMRQMIDANELTNEQEVLIRECLEAGADNISLFREVDIYYSPYCLRMYITDIKKNEGIFWLEFERENNWGFFESDEEVYEIFSEFENEHWDD